MPMALGLGLGLPYMAGPSGPSPALDLNFAAMAASQALDSRITYAGASLATLVNAAGLIAYKPHNLLLYSEELDNAAWTVLGTTITADATVGPDGTLTADKLVAQATTNWHARRQTAVVLTSGVATTFSVYAKAAEETKLAISDYAIATTGAVFDLLSKTAIVTGSDAGMIVSNPTITDVGNGWFRCTLTMTASVAGRIPTIYLRQYLTSYVGDGTSGIYLWGAQLNLGPLQPYYPTTSAAYFGPRFTYDPITLNPLGLLIEEQRTNLLTYSEKFDNAIWLKQTLTVTANQYTAPDGSTTADALVPTSGDSALTYDIAPASAVAHTFSIWLRSTTGSSFSLDIRLFRDSPFASISTQSVTLTTAWQRFTFTRTPLDTSTHRWRIGTGSSWATGEDAAAWGAQLEAGAFATSYIPTTSASVTRAADSATMTGANFSSWFNATQGTCVAEGRSANTGISGLAFFSDGTAQNNIALQSNGGSNCGQSSIYSGNVLQANFPSLGAWTLGSTGKVAVQYATNSSISAVNGSLGTTDTSCVMPAGMNRIDIGSWVAVSGVQNLNGPISRLRYYNTALTNAQLQALTA